MTSLMLCFGHSALPMMSPEFPSIPGMFELRDLRVCCSLFWEALCRFQQDSLPWFLYSSTQGSLPSLCLSLISPHTVFKRPPCSLTSSCPLSTSETGVTRQRFALASFVHRFIWLPYESLGYTPFVSSEGREGETIGAISAPAPLRPLRPIPWGHIKSTIWDLGR